MSAGNESGDSLGVQLAKSHRRSAIGCGSIALLILAAVCLGFYLLAPAWLFVGVLVVCGLIGLIIAYSVISQAARMGSLEHEFSGKWQTGKPRQVSPQTLATNWQGLKSSVDVLLISTRRYVRTVRDDPSLGGPYVAAMEEGSAPEESGYWSCVSAINSYRATLSDYRSQVRDLMPAIGEEGAILVQVESWLSELIDNVDNLRQEFVFREPKRPFDLELIEFLEDQPRPPNVDEAIEQRLAQSRVMGL